jgi:hypothetical protein
MHIDTPRPRCLDPVQQQLRLAPIVRAGELHMRQLHMDPTGLADIDGLSDGLVDAVGFVPDMGGIPRFVFLQY